MSHLVLEETLHLLVLLELTHSNSFVLDAMTSSVFVDNVRPEAVLLFLLDLSEPRNTIT